MKKNRDYNMNQMPFFPGSTPYAGTSPYMGMPNMIPMPMENNSFDNQISNLNNRINLLEKRVAKLEGPNATTTYDTNNYYMV